MLERGVILLIAFWEFTYGRVIIKQIQFCILLIINKILQSLTPKLSPNQQNRNKKMQKQAQQSAVLTSPSGSISISLEEQLQILSTFILSKIKHFIQRHGSLKKRFLIAVCGIPGSGKSTISSKLSGMLPNCRVLPMDGFHLYRKELNQQGVRRRGAAFTFNLVKFVAKLNQIKQSYVGEVILYPDFDHKEKDPVQDSIKIQPNIEIVVVQGLYVLDQNLPINKPQQSQNQFWDVKVWINSDIDICIQRVAKRHLESGIEPNYEMAYKRANTNDRSNALYVIQNCYLKHKSIQVDQLNKNNDKSTEYPSSDLIIVDNSLNVNTHHQQK